MKKIIALLLALTMLFCFAACGNSAQIVVAEKESAGEGVAKSEDDFKDYTYTAVDTQAKALMEVSAGTADAAVVDYVMSIGSIGEGTDYENLKVEGNGYSEEEYGIAFRKGSDLTAKVNEIIRELKANGDLKDIAKKYKIQRVVAELNGMQLVGDIYRRFPENWAVAQEVMFADATTFMTYNANMRNLVMDKLVGGQMVVFNRLAPGQDTMPLHKIVRAANRRMDILYDYTDGTTAFDEMEDPLPFDIKAPVIMVNDEDYALWYRDVTEEPQKYDGKTVSFKGQVAMLRREKNSMFAPGRFVMTCCEDDIQFLGVPCKYEKVKTLEPRSWVAVTANISAENHTLYGGELGPVLTAIKVEPAQPAEPDVATF